MWTPVILLAIGFAAGVPVAALASPQEWPDPGSLAQTRPRIGIQVQPMTPELREHFKAPSDRGLLVTRVVQGMPGARSGIEVGDVITSAGRKPVREPFDLTRAVGRVPEGESLSLQIVRDGEERVIVVEPEGEATPWIDPDYWNEWIERGVLQGSRELRRQLEELDERLRELERRFEERQEQESDEGKQRT